MAATVKCDLPYVDGFEDRHGRLRFYFRRKGKRIALPGEPGSEQFLEAYQAALACKPAAIAGTATQGSFDDLRQTYFQSAEFQNLRASTQQETRYAIDALCRRANKSGVGTVGDNPVAKLERKHILGWRDAMAKRPGAANKMLRVLKLLLSFGVDRGFRHDNPAKGIKLLKGGRIRSWTDDELLAFEARWPLGTLQRTGYALALYTTQRRADLTRLKWSSIAGDAIHLTQGKTGAAVVLPIHAELKKALAAVAPRCEAAILVGAGGKALNPVYFGAIMAKAIAAAGLPNACVLHGLRKSGARLIAEAGGKVGSMTGHLTAAMEAEYSRDASQKRLAKDTVIAWDKATKKRRAATK